MDDPNKKPITEEMIQEVLDEIEKNDPDPFKWLEPAGPGLFVTGNKESGIMYTGIEGAKQLQEFCKNNLKK